MGADSDVAIAAGVFLVLARFGISCKTLITQCTFGRLSRQSAEVLQPAHAHGLKMLEMLEEMKLLRERGCVSLQGALIAPTSCIIMRLVP